MKNVFLKSIVLVAAVIIAAIIAVLIQYFGEEPKVTMGYIEDTTPPCSTAIQCSENPGELCTILVIDTLYRAYGKTSPFPTSCTKVLYKP